MEQKPQATSEDQLREVIQYYSFEIHKNPKDSTNLVLRSACYESLHEYSKALKDALQVIDNDPSYWKGHHQAMKLHLLMHNVEEANKTPEKYKQSEVFKKLYDELNSQKMIKENQAKSQLAKPIEGIPPKTANYSFETTRVTMNQQESTNKPSTSFTNTSEQRRKTLSEPTTNSKPAQTIKKIPNSSNTRSIRNYEMDHEARIRTRRSPLDAVESSIRLTNEPVRRRSSCCCG